MRTASRKEERGEGGSTATRILDVSEELFAERGFAAVSVREIAARVGLNQASIYNHFASKQALYQAVLERGLAPIRKLLEQGGPPGEGDALLEALVAQLWRTPNLPKLVQREILDDGEVLERLSEQWLGPIYRQGRRTMESFHEVAGSWSDAEVPLVVIGMYHLLFGHFISAALTRRVTGVDPFSADTRRLHLDFLKRATHRLMGLVDDKPSAAR
jgi:AcrR family transcriptional regulator